jgi:predicted DNA-binding transcriptional regulator AlpA
MTPRALPRKSAAEYLGCSPSAFDDRVKSGVFPQPRLVGTKPVWDRHELDDAFESLPRKAEDGNEWDAITPEAH